MNTTMPEILLADDMVEMLETEQALLEECGLGYKVTPCATCEQALELLHDRAFDLVILDVMLPMKGGLETIRAIRHVESNAKDVSKIPILVYSGYLDKVPPNVLIKEGANVVLSKPAPLDLFLNCIRGLLEPQAETTFIVVKGFEIREVRNSVLHVMVQKALAKAHKDLHKAAQLLGVSPQCLFHLLQKFSLVPRD